MKRIDFGVECPGCKIALHIPLQVEENVYVDNGANFVAECHTCYTEFKVNIQISTETVISSTLRC